MRRAAACERRRRDVPCHHAKNAREHTVRAAVADAVVVGDQALEHGPIKADAHAAIRLRVAVYAHGRRRLPAGVVALDAHAGGSIRPIRPELAL